MSRDGHGRPRGVPPTCDATRLRVFPGCQPGAVKAEPPFLSVEGGNGGGGLRRRVVRCLRGLYSRFVVGVV